MVNEEAGERGVIISHVRIMRQGEVFAYREMLTKSTHSKTTLARGNIELLALSNADLMEVLHEFPDVYQDVFQHATNQYNYSI